MTKKDIMQQLALKIIHPHCLRCGREMHSTSFEQCRYCKWEGTQIHVSPERQIEIRCERYYSGDRYNGLYPTVFELHTASSVQAGRPAHEFGVFPRSYSIAS